VETDVQAVCKNLIGAFPLVEKEQSTGLFAGVGECSGNIRRFCGLPRRESVSMNGG